MGNNSVYTLLWIYDFPDPPVCKKAQKIQYISSLHETLNVVCDVDGEPTDGEFEWTFNNSVETPMNIPDNEFRSEKMRSVLRYTPRTKADYGILSCAAKNQAGKMTQPCRYTITFAGM